MGRAGLLCALVVLTAGAARGDRLKDLLFDVEAGKKVAVEMTRSVALVSVTLKVPEWADARLAPRGTATAVAVIDPVGLPRLVTTGPIAAEAASLKVRTPDDQWHPVLKVVIMGDGALAELVIAPAALAQLIPLPIDPRERVAEEAIVFTPLGISTPTLHLVRGSVAQELDGPASHLLVVDIALPNGAPLITAEGAVLGVTFRHHPSDRKRALAVTPETLRAWLRPEGPPVDSTPAPAPTPGG